MIGTLFENKINKLRKESQAKRQDRNVAEDVKPEVEKEVQKIERVQERRFDELMKKSTEVLFSAKSVFPFDFFPTEITVTIHKVDIVYNSFYTRTIQPVYIQNISDVFVTRGFLFSTLTIVDAGFTNHTLVVKNMKNEDALEAMKVIQGLVVSTKQRIDLTQIEMQDLAEKVRVIGAPSGSY